MFKGERIKRNDWIVLGGLALLAVLSFFISVPDGKVHVWFLDVGQGDAIFIETPSGRQILVDGGPDRTILRRLGEVMPFYDHTIDLVIATHPDADHLAGLVEVLEKYQVKNILETGMECKTALCVEWERIKPQEKAEINYAKWGEEMALADGARLLILHPFDELINRHLSLRNNGAVVAKLLFGEQSLLLTADIEAMVEKKLLLSRVNLDADFLKVAHHGSKTSTTEEFLKAVTPLAAFMEVGAKNRYGHPTSEVLSRLENFHIPYYRTDTDGTVELVLDGKNYLIKN